MIRFLPAPLLMLVAACNAAPDDPAAVTPDEARQLNDAAAMLDNDSVSADAIAGTSNDR